MIINLSPQRRDDTLVLEKNGDVLTFNGEVVNLTDMPEGSTLPPFAVDCGWILPTEIRRVDGRIELTIIMPHGQNPQSHVAFPEPIIDPPDGLIVFPENSK